MRIQIPSVLIGGMAATLAAAAAPHSASASATSEGSVRNADVSRSAAIASHPSAPSQSIVITDPGPRYLGDPPVPRPGATPCVVTLFSNVLLDVDNTWRQAYDYVPPSGCSGPWLKVVLETDYAFDPDVAFGSGAAGALWLDGSLLQFGGTPNSDETPGHFERDITDYATLLRRAGSGHVVLDAAFAMPFITDDLFVRATARVLIYPASNTSAAPRTPDAVFPLIRMSRDDQTILLQSGQNTLATTFTLPRNIERAYLDVLVFGSNGLFGTDGDTIWWSCTPAGISLPLLQPRSPYQGDVGVCARGAFREGEISIDGRPAGVVPIAPWLTHLGMNAFALAPEPAHNQNLVPYRVDLTPFAGVLSDGAPHTVAITVVGGGATGDDVAFQAAGSLLAYRDAGSAQVSGGVTSNTLAGQPPIPQVTSTLQNTGTNTVGTVTTTLRREFVIEGFVDTSRGRIRNRVAETVAFANTQRLNNHSSGNQYRYLQAVQLDSTVRRSSSSWAGTTRVRNDNQQFGFPLGAFYRDQDIVLSGQPIHQTTSDMRQGIHQTGSHGRLGTAGYTDRTDVEFDSVADRSVDDSGQVVDQSADGLRRWNFVDSRGSCYSTYMTVSISHALQYSAGADCPGSRNAVHWFAHTDGSPASLGWLETH